MSKLPTISVDINMLAAAAKAKSGPGGLENDDAPSTITLTITWGQRKKLRAEAVAKKISTSQHASHIFNKLLEE